MENNMSAIQDKLVKIFIKYLEERNIIYETILEPQTYGDVIRIDTQGIKDHCTTKIYANGTIQNQAKPESKLKIILEGVKSAVEKGEMIPETLPFEIESFPQTLMESIPNIDPIVIGYFSEAITCYKARAYLATAFLVGAASEKAVWIMIDSYINAIIDDSNQKSIRLRVANKFISRAYDEFMISFKACKTKPKDPVLTDWEVMVEAMFQFFRVTRNDVGHPAIVPIADPGSLLANMGQFCRYIKTIYRLIDYFQKTAVIV